MATVFRDEKCSWTAVGSSFAIPLGRIRGRSVLFSEHPAPQKGCRILFCFSGNAGSPSITIISHNLPDFNRRDGTFSVGVWRSNMVYRSCRDMVYTSVVRSKGKTGGASPSRRLIRKHIFDDGKRNPMRGILTTSVCRDDRRRCGSVCAAKRETFVFYRSTVTITVPRLVRLTVYSPHAGTYAPCSGQA